MHCGGAVESAIAVAPFVADANAKPPNAVARAVLFLDALARAVLAPTPQQPPALALAVLFRSAKAVASPPISAVTLAEL